MLLLRKNLKGLILTQSSKAPFLKPTQPNGLSACPSCCGQAGNGTGRWHTAMGEEMAGLPLDPILCAPCQGCPHPLTQPWPGKMAPLHPSTHRCRPQPLALPVPPRELVRVDRGLSQNWRQLSEADDPTSKGNACVLSLPFSSPSLSIAIHQAQL